MSVESVLSEEITVVIQGPVSSKRVEEAIDSIRQFLPGAKIIISTWKNEPCENLDVDHLILTDEPEPFRDLQGNPNNIVKQVISTRKGLEAVKTKYALKFRADHKLKSPEIASIRSYDPMIPKEKRYFASPITITNLFTPNPTRLPMLFHFSDLVQFGLTEDLKKLWSIDLPNQSTLYSEKAAKPRLVGNFIGLTNLKQVPEQSIILGWLKKEGIPIHFRSVSDMNYSTFKFAEELLATHFYLKDWERSGIVYPDRFHRLNSRKNIHYTEKEMEKIRNLLNRRIYFFRYLWAWSNKYFFCWLNLRYLRKSIVTLFFLAFPTLAEKVRHFYREKTGGK